MQFILRGEHLAFIPSATCGLHHVCSCLCQVLFKPSGEITSSAVTLNRYILHIYKGALCGNLSPCHNCRGDLAKNLRQQVQQQAEQEAAEKPSMPTYGTTVRWVHPRILTFMLCLQAFPAVLHVFELLTDAHVKATAPVELLCSLHTQMIHASAA